MSCRVWQVDLGDTALFQEQTLSGDGDANKSIRTENALCLVIVSHGGLRIGQLLECNWMNKTIDSFIAP